MQSEPARGFFPDPHLLTMLTSFSASCSLVPDIKCSFWCLMSLVTSQAASWVGILNSNWTLKLILVCCFVELTLPTPGIHSATSVLCRNITMQMVPNIILFWGAMAASWQPMFVFPLTACAAHTVCKDTVTRQDLYSSQRSRLAACVPNPFLLYVFISAIRFRYQLLHNRPHRNGVV